MALVSEQMRMHAMCLLVGVVMSSLLTAPVTPTLAFEAAFQGSCGEKNPCEQLCFDLYDGTFECGCAEGSTLAKDGYSCYDGTMNGVDPLIRVKGTYVVDGRRTGRLQSLSRTRDFPSPAMSSSNHPNEVTSGHHERYKSTAIKKTKKLQQQQQQQQPSQVPATMQSIALASDKNCATCDENGGQCIPEMTKCLCPLGRSGKHCQQTVFAKFPRFFGQSYLTLPVLKNAFRNFQIALEFHPETSDGLLLFSGSEKTSDLMALLLVGGHVEFRFDCGSGMGVVRSAEPILLHSWNRLVVYRHRWDAWLQLNGGLHTQGRSKGLLSRITFREQLYVGGIGNFTRLHTRLQVEFGFVGCIRHLEINEHSYDLRYNPKGEAVDGRDISDCNSNLCNQMVCLNSGTCTSTESDKALCLCPLGFIGPHCEQEVNLVMPHFNGSSHLKFPGLGNSALSFIEMSIEFKPNDADGLLLYNGYKMDGTGDFLSLGLTHGHVEFRFDLGTGPAILRSREPVSLNDWHSVFVSRTGRDGILQVDRQPAVEGMAEGAFTQLSLPQNLYLGGVPSFDDISHKIEQRSNFKGCIQKLVVNNQPIKMLDAALNGVNVNNCDHLCIRQPCLNQGTCIPHDDRFSCHCQIGYTDTRCQTEVLDRITIPMFSGNSYLKFTQEDIVKRIVGSRVAIDLKVKVVVGDGLVLWTGEREMTSSSDFLAIGLRSGFVHLRYNLGSGEAQAVANHTRVDDGHWHHVKVVRTDQEGTLVVDTGPTVSTVSPGPLKQLNTNNGLYLGGMENLLHLSLNKYSMGMTGCVSELRLATEFHVEFVSHATSGMNIRMCV